jgi:hypothetical protein
LGEEREEHEVIGGEMNFGLLYEVKVLGCTGRKIG